MTRWMIYVSNALDDATRIERGISTDSPAASRKAFLISRAIRHAGARAIILSLGRGRIAKGRYFPATIRRANGTPVFYAPFRTGRVLSYAISFIAPAVMLWRLRRLPGEKTVVFHNRMGAFVLVLLAARLFGMRCVLNFEDGEMARPSLTRRVICALYDGLCDGALLITSTLASGTRIKRTTCFNTTVEKLSIPHDWTARPISALMCGSLWRETGSVMLADAIARLRREQPSWSRNLEVVVTGSGDCIALFEDLAALDAAPRVVVRGRTTNSEYKDILANSHIGLALKLNEGSLADTTFPSKVIEFANSGLLVLSTDISDVRRVFGGNALYLERDEPGLLIERLGWAVQNAGAAAAIAAGGHRTVWEQFAPEKAGAALANFLFPETNPLAIP